MVKKRKIKTKLPSVLDKTRLSKEYPWLNIAELQMLCTGGYFDSEGVLHNDKGCIRCTSMVKSTGLRCKNFTIPGELCCRFHGGYMARAKRGTTRLYSAFIQDPKLKNVFNEVMDNEEIAGVKSELTLLRTLLAQVIGSSKRMDTRKLKNISSVVKEIRTLVNDFTKAEVRLGQLIDIGKVVIITKALANIITKYVKDEEVIEKIARDFDNILWPAPLASTPQPCEQKSIRKVSELPGEVR